MSSPNFFKLSSLILISLGLMACGTKSFNLPSADQSYVQNDTANTKVDMLIMSDNSSSMMRNQNKLASQIPALIDALNAQGMDWQIGVVTSDMSGTGSGGYLLGAVGEEFVTPRTANAVAKLQQRIVAGENGSDLERGADSVKSALISAQTLLRRDALLSVIFLSDENDSSSTTPTQFVSFMDGLKPAFRSGLRSWVANFIGIVALDQECTTNGYFAGTGTKYMQIVDLSGGTKESLCKTSLSQAAQNVRVRMSELLTEFALARAPKPETIHVLINGVEVPKSTSNGYEYISSKQVIKFHGSKVPTPADVVTVNYDPLDAT